MPNFERTPKPEEASSNPFRKLAESKMARAGAVALGIHAAALSPQVLEGVKRTREAAAAFESEWFREHTVVHPQSKEWQQSLRLQIQSREARADKEALQKYEHDTSEKLKKGEEVSFKRLYFDLERLNGVPASEVEKAEKKAEALIDRFSEMAGEDLDEEEIRSISKEMAGPDSNFLSGQASVTEYFNTDRRNCDSFNMGQQIVFEGVVQHLAEKNRARFVVGERHEKHHVIATITERRASGKDRIFILESGGVRVASDEPEAGTAQVDAGFFKKTTVSDEIVSLNAAPGQVRPSPDLDLVVNRPIPRGFVVLGELKSSNFEMEQARKEGAKVEMIPKEKIIQTDILMETKRQDSSDLPKERLVNTDKSGEPILSLGMFDSGRDFHLSNADFSEALSAHPEAKTIQIDTSDLRLYEYEALKRSHAETLDFSNIQVFPRGIPYADEGPDIRLADLSAENYDAVALLIKYLDRAGKKVVLNGEAYLHQLVAHEWLIEYTNVVPDFTYTEVDVLQSILRDTSIGIKPKFAQLKKQLEKEIKHRSELAAR
jgi:hypothetical protein